MAGLLSSNQLPDPYFASKIDFEQELQDFKALLLDELSSINEDMRDAIEQTLKNDAEALTRFSRVFVRYMQLKLDREAYNRKQEFAVYAQGDNLDVAVSALGVVRQIIVEADPDAQPPVEELKESDAHVLVRYLLQPFMPSAGSRNGYRASVFMLDNKPLVTVEKPSATEVVLRFKFAEGAEASKVKDTQTRRVTPGVVNSVLLSQEVDSGVPSAEFLAYVESHLKSGNQSPETDSINMLAAQITSYTIAVDITVEQGASKDLIQTSIESALREYVADQHYLGAQILRSRIDQVCHNNGAVGINIVSPAADISTAYTHAPFCSGVTVSASYV